MWPPRPSPTCPHQPHLPPEKSSGKTLSRGKKTACDFSFCYLLWQSFFHWSIYRRCKVESFFHFCSNKYKKYTNHVAVLLRNTNSNSDHKSLKFRWITSHLTPSLSQSSPHLTYIQLPPMSWFRYIISQGYSPCPILLSEFVYFQAYFLCYLLTFYSSLC